MKTSETIAALAAALSAAQGEMKNAVFNKKNPHFNSSYADLSSVRDATLNVLSKHKLCIVQTTVLDAGAFLLLTRLIHESGEWIESEYPLPMSDKPHVMGSAIAYAKRYSWAAISAVASDGDDDGNVSQTEAEKLPRHIAADPAVFIEQKLREAADWQGDGTIEDLMKVWSAQQPAIKRLSKEAQDRLTALKDELKAELTTPQQSGDTSDTSDAGGAPVNPLAAG